MNFTRRRVVAGSLAAVPLALAGRAVRAQGVTTLKISHQFPGGTIDSGDFRDRLCRKFAQDVEKKTNGALKFDIYPNSSLVKVNSQFSALRKGALDLSLVPLSYAGGEVAETNRSAALCEIGDRVRASCDEYQLGSIVALQH